MSVSVKKATNKTNIKHNNRTMSDKEKKRNAHIDYSRSHENKYLVQEDIKKLYEHEFGEALEKYNAKQKRSDRKIDNYYKHIELSKKTSTQQEMIIQVGDKDDFSNEENRELANEILKNWFKNFEERNPNLKVYNAVIHNDEASPHMHLNFVPVAEGYKRGLERQVAFDRAIKQQDPTLNKTRPFEDWREKEVKILEGMLNERGIERKLVGTNEYKDVNEYKEKKDQLREIEDEIQNKREELQELTKIFPDEKEKIPFLKKETEFVKAGFMKREEKETGNYVLTPDQYKEVDKKISAAVAIKKDYDRLKNTDLVKENRKLKLITHEAINKGEDYKKKNKVLKRHNEKLYWENDDLKAEISRLKRDIKIIYKSVKEFVKEHTRSLKAFKGVFQELVDKG